MSTPASFRHESCLEVCRPVEGSSVPNGPSSPSSLAPAPSSPKAGRTGLKNRLETSNASLTFWLSHMGGRVSTPGWLPGTVEGSVSVVSLEGGTQKVLEPGPQTPIANAVLWGAPVRAAATRD